MSPYNMMHKNFEWKTIDTDYIKSKVPITVEEVITEKDGLRDAQTFHGISKSKHIPNTAHYKILRYKHADTKRIRRIMEC